MKKIPILILFFTSQAFATQSLKLEEVKCADLSKRSNHITPDYLALVAGYDHRVRKTDENVDMGEIVSQSKEIDDKCRKAKNLKIIAVRNTKKVRPTAPTGKSGFNPIRATCQNFLELSEDVQPVAVFWTAGQTEAGKTKNGEFDEELINRPIVTLIEECRKNPKESFYAKTKAWFKKQI